MSVRKQQGGSGLKSSVSLTKRCVKPAAFQKGEASLWEIAQGFKGIECPLKIVGVDLSWTEAVFHLC